MGSQSASVYLPASPAEAREQLDRILSSPDFILPDRGRRFLRFIVSETLEGRAAYLKAFTIAVSVFGRDASFDAQNDPCVRMSARHLRSALERYYLTSGSADKVLIAVPSGGYTPTFTERMVDGGNKIGGNSESTSPTTKSPTAQPRAEQPKRQSTVLRWIMISAGLIVLATVVMASLTERNNPALKQPVVNGGRPTILVERFTTNEETRVSDEVLRGLTSAIITNLVKSELLVVFSEDGKPNSREPDTTYTLQGSIRLEGNHLRAIARLLRRADGVVAWSSDYDLDIKGRNLLDVQTAIARSISAAVTAPISPEGSALPEAGDTHARK